MADEKFKFRFMGLQTLEERVDVAIIDSLLEQGNSKPEVSNSLNLSVHIDSTSEKVCVRAGVEYSHQDHPIFVLVVESLFNVVNLKKHLTKEGNNYTLKNKGFLFFLVDQSIAHLRAIQASKFEQYQSLLRFVPFIPAYKIMNEKNEVVA